MATVYHRNQAGAPILQYSTNGSLVAHFTALKDILKACLVYGYGDRPAAGWSLINEGSDFIVLRNGSQSGYLCLSWSGAIVTVWLSETYTGMNGNVMTGDGLKTGVASGNGVPQRFSISRLAYSYNTVSWVVIADQATFVICSAFTSSTYAMEFSNAGNFTLYAGEDDGGRFLSIGGINTTTASTTSSYSPEAHFGSTGMTVLRNPADGLIVGGGSISVATPGSMRQPNGGGQTEGTPLGEVSLCPMHWCGGGVFAGRLKGIVMVPSLSYTGNATRAADALGCPVTINTGNADTPIDLGDSNNYFVRMGYQLTTFFLVTDNPEFW